MFNIIVAIVLYYVALTLAPKPKTEKPDVEQITVPEASADKPIPVVFGEVEITSPNVVFWGDKWIEVETKGGGK